MMRLDQALVVAGVADSRSRAQALIGAGVVRIDGDPAKKPAQKVGPDVVLSLTENPNPFVSRAALKLNFALREFNLSPKGAIALDVGASTGGFTEVLLNAGVARVYALDVGHGQLHPRIENDPKVVNLEGINAKGIPDELLPPLDWIVTDVSFISLTKAMPRPLSLARSGAIFVGLIKPQFEVGRGKIGKGGIVRDAIAHEATREHIGDFLGASGWQVTHSADSPILGGDGNKEFLIAAQKL
ncbi:MAG: TlyA family RNA methyltransferase [Rhodobacteraceae bacterium]|nr:TlyA family RNA methyltransferase [Paracoccaceae bacterium]